MMNEKFMELADRLTWESDVNYGELMRFAALIVRECAGIDFRHKVGMTTDQEFDTGRAILEHFGVK